MSHYDPIHGVSRKRDPVHYVVAGISVLALVALAIGIIVYARRQQAREEAEARAESERVAAEARAESNRVAVVEKELREVELLLATNLAGSTAGELARLKALADTSGDTPYRDRILEQIKRAQSMQEQHVARVAAEAEAQRQQSAEAARQAEAARAKTIADREKLVRDIAAQMVRREALSAWSLLSDARAAGLFTAEPADAGGAEAELDLCVRYPEMVMEGFRPEVGRVQRIAVPLADGTAPQVQVSEIKGQALDVVQRIPRPGGGSGESKFQISYAQLAPAEKLNRIRSRPERERNLISGLIALEVKNPARAREFFERSGAPVALEMAALLGGSGGAPKETSAPAAGAKPSAKPAAAPAGAREDAARRTLAVIVGIMGEDLGDDPAALLGRLSARSARPGDRKLLTQQMNYFQSTHGPTQTASQWAGVLAALANLAACTGTPADREPARDDYASWRAALRSVSSQVWTNVPLADAGVAAAGESLRVSKDRPAAGAVRIFHPRVLPQVCDITFEAVGASRVAVMPATGLDRGLAYVPIDQDRHTNRLVRTGKSAFSLSVDGRAVDLRPSDGWVADGDLTLAVEVAEKSALEIRGYVLKTPGTR